MLPFDSDDNRETARQTIYEPVPFNHPIWDFVSMDAKDLIKGLLHKDKLKRISLDQVLTHPWICKRNKDMQELRRKSNDFSKFSVYTATLAKYLPQDEASKE